MFDDAIVTRHALAASEAMRWGYDDCCQFVRRVVMDHGGLDLLAGVPAYDSQPGAARAIGGCLVTFAVHQAARLGLDGVPRSDWGGRRDVMIVGLVASDNGPALALRHKGAWLARAETGVIVMGDRAAVIAWGVSCPR